ncbi:hypothetical protein EMCG_08343 [[Emmonsia] crescens]|uniref:Uncharacterized protein n=1 Tax=[Emmonsia] crescens TaxID=73230 RepID=A0A0G2I649_9EURO|nr:hypothetical protein EMCG_08343 [Emmonsia crescens UAMH 3008]
MIAMLDGMLTLPYPPDQLYMPPPLRRATLHIVDESTVSAVLLKWNHTIVDRALELASGAFAGGVNSMAWTLGSHADLPGEAIFPDWAGLGLNASFPTSNRVPGDSKVSGKWYSAQLEKDDSDRREFFKPLCQVVYYARLFNTRYAYVVSDKELVCIRRSTSEYEGSPLACRRIPRGTEPPITPSRRSGQLSREPSTSSPTSPPFQVVISYRQPQNTQHFPTPQRRFRPRRSSIASTISAMSVMSLDSPGVVISSPSDIRSSPSNYTDDGNPNMNEAMVEIAIIPWGETRSKHLTINLALFWIHILASFDIDLKASTSFTIMKWLKNEKTFHL